MLVGAGIIYIIEDYTSAEDINISSSAATLGDTLVSVDVLTVEKD